MKEEKHIPTHMSDCAVHNEPAYPNGPCTCGYYSNYEMMGFRKQYHHGVSLIKELDDSIARCEVVADHFDTHDDTYACLIGAKELIKRAQKLIKKEYVKPNKLYKDFGKDIEVSVIIKEGCNE